MESKQNRLTLPTSSKELLSELRRAYKELNTSDESDENFFSGEPERDFKEIMESLIEDATKNDVDKEELSIALHHEFPDAKNLIDQIIPLPKPKKRKIISPTAHYKDAYSVAEGLVSTGSLVQAIGLIVGFIAVVAGAVIGYSLGNSVVAQSQSFTAVGLLAGMLIGLFVGGGLYGLGVLISGLGQLLEANLDTAVNTAVVAEHFGA